MLRLSPTGKRGQKFFRLIVSEKTKDVFGKYLELLGNYNNHKSPAEANLKVDRIKYWLAQGAQPSPTVHNLLVDQKIITEPKVAAWKPKKKKDEEGTPKAEGDKKPEAAAEAVKEKPAEAPVETPTKKPEAKPSEAKPEEPAEKPAEKKSEAPVEKPTESAPEKSKSE
ncbi:MAG: 30S ribosomal protein S16 [Patescibacteria group bacterium]|nr:30S ribosomal protein S16 [Patescibacteria group bacterium]